MRPRARWHRPEDAAGPGPFADLLQPVSIAPASAATQAKMEFHFQMRFHKAFYQIRGPITLAAFSPACSWVTLSLTPLPPEAAVLRASPSLQEQIKGLPSGPLITRRDIRPQLQSHRDPQGSPWFLRLSCLISHSHTHTHTDMVSKCKQP